MAAANKTQPGDGDVDAFLAAVPDERRRADAITANVLIGEVTGAEPVLWGSSMVGYGRQRYEYASGRAGTFFAVGFAPRKAALTLYGLTYQDSNADLLARLGPHTTGKGCLYVKRLDDLDRDVLAELIRRAYATNHTG
jgi:hypothetical protein